mmetsp:Transcript_73601/g.124012  ORF Transcript_73601/g.124012 Transcript_73601/m.124012 type:complete len:80 (-) Transcript_73601:814-1053(-)
MTNFPFHLFLARIYLFEVFEGTTSAQQWDAQSWAGWAPCSLHCNVTYKLIFKPPLSLGFQMLPMICHWFADGSPDLAVS